MRAHLLRLVSSLTLIVVLAFVFRLAFVVRQASLVPRDVLATVPFENEAGNIAQALARGNGFCCVFRQPTGPTAWLAPVYPLILAGIFKVSGTFTVASFYVASILNCVFSSLVCIPVFFAGKRVGGMFSGALAAWIWALFPSGIILPFEWIWDTSLSALLAAMLLWATLRVADAMNAGETIGYGALWGFSLMANPALGSLLPFFVGWIAFRQIRLGRWTPKALLLALLLTVTICLPWTIRNAVQFHQIIPLRSNFPFELWMGNNEIYDEHSREVNRITRYEQVNRYRELGETAFLGEKWRKSKAFILEQPSLCLRLAARRLVATWFGTSSPWTDFVHADSLLIRFLFFWNTVTVIGSIAGIGRLFMVRCTYAFPLAIVPVAFPLVYYFTQTSLRLRHPCDPILALLLAVSVSSAGVFATVKKAQQS